MVGGILDALTIFRRSLVITVHIGLSIAKFALGWLAACHYLHNIIT
jgi:hypothetical protein